MTKYAPYEPGEPEDVKAKAKAEADKQAKHDNRIYVAVETLKWIGWIALVLVVVSAIIFGLNRWVHDSNSDNRYRQQFVTTCMMNNDTFGYFNGEAICFHGTVVSSINADQKKDCLAQGNYPIDVSQSQNTMYMCMSGKIVAVL